jgi:predicted metalloprotease with PDZ domain
MADITKFFDKEFEQKEFNELIDAPVDAIAGLSKADAEALTKALNIKTIGDLAENKYVLIAQAVAALSRSGKR